MAWELVKDDDSDLFEGIVNILLAPLKLKKMKI